MSVFEDESGATATLSSVFPGMTTALWEDDAQYAEYLDNLTSYSLERLADEPTRIQVRLEDVQQRLRILAWDNYKAFVRTSECGRDMKAEFSSLATHLDSLLTTLPTLSSTVTKFNAFAPKLTQSRTEQSKALHNHTQLLEVLEIPQLMSLCVRQQSYEEALELEAHVVRLARRHGDIALVHAIVEEVGVSSRVMLHQLLQTLRTSIPLPLCLRTVGHLRRTGAFSEPELRLRFLHARAAWLRGVVAVTPVPVPGKRTHGDADRTALSDTAAQAVMNYIEGARQHIFDIVTQYRAVFANDADADAPAGGLLCGWVLHEVHLLHSLLRTHLPLIASGATLSSLLAHTMRFGVSFSRICADFRPLFSPLFARVAVSLFSRALDSALSAFVVRLESYDSPQMRSITVSDDSSSDSHSVPSTVPPRILLTHPPLALFTNDVLSALNDLRVCAPLHSRTALATMLSRVLRRACEAVSATTIAVESSLSADPTPTPPASSGTHTTFVHLSNMLRTVCVPYLVDCFAVVYPSPPRSSLVPNEPDAGRLDADSITKIHDSNE